MTRSNSTTVSFVIYTLLRNVNYITPQVNRDVFKREHPEVLKPLLPEVEQFAKHNHFNILHTILRYEKLLTTIAYV